MRQKKALIAACIAIVLVGGGYGAYDYFAGNHIAVKEVIQSDVSAADIGSTVAADKINGKWIIQPASELYFSVTTSKESVNFKFPSVEGNWNIDTSNTGNMKAEGKVNTLKLDSGNSMRDNDIQGDRFLNTATFPEATFTVNSFSQLPKEWKSRTVIPFKMTGIMTVKGVSKEVTFDSKAQYVQGTIKVEGSTVVTFNDFGMENPHTVLLDTQNNVIVQLRLDLEKETK